jgi:hypothetical protein
LIELLLVVFIFSLVRVYLRLIFLQADNGPPALYVDRHQAQADQERKQYKGQAVIRRQLINRVQHHAQKVAYKAQVKHESPPPAVLYLWNRIVSAPVERIAFYEPPDSQVSAL